MTSSKAVWRGIWIVAFPIMPIMFLSWFFIFGGMQYLGLPVIMSFIVSAIVGFFLACLWGAWRAPRWRLWALQNVEDTQDLLPKAIAAGISYKSGHWFERFEIKSEAHREQEKALIAKIKKGERNAYSQSNPHEYTHIEGAYVFWARPRSIIPFDLGRLSVKYILCQVTDTTVELDHEGYKLSIPVADILSCQTGSYSSRGTPTSYYVEFKFTENSMLRTDLVDRSYILIELVHPLNGNSSIDERDALFAVVNGLKSDVKPDLDRNPYRRQLIREEREEEFFDHVWDPVKPPPAYSYIPGGMHALQIIVIIGSIILPFGIIYLIMSILEAAGILEKM